MTYVLNAIKPVMRKYLAHVITYVMGIVRVLAILLVMGMYVHNVIHLVMDITHVPVIRPVMAILHVHVTTSVIVKDVNLIPVTVTESAMVIQRVPVTIRATVMCPALAIRVAMLIHVTSAMILVMDILPVVVI